MIDTSKLPGCITEALDGREFTRFDVAGMSPSQVFKEYCAWTIGDTGWGEILERALDACRAAEINQKDL